MKASFQQTSGKSVTPTKFKSKIKRKLFYIDTDMMMKSKFRVTTVDSCQPNQQGSAVNHNWFYQ